MDYYTQAIVTLDEATVESIKKGSMLHIEARDRDGYEAEMWIGLATINGHPYMLCDSQGNGDSMVQEYSLKHEKRDLEAFLQNHVLKEFFIVEKIELKGENIKRKFCSDNDETDDPEDGQELEDYLREVFLVG